MTSKAIKEDLQRLSAAWDIAEKEIVLLPVLRDDDLTVERFCEKKKITKAVARKALDKLVEAQKFVKVLCRAATSGGHVVAYRVKGQK
jgi:predicted transcriptional regulator